VHSVTVVVDMLEFFSLIYFIKMEKLAYEITILSLCVSMHVCLCLSVLSTFEPVDDFHEIWYGCYAIEGHPNCVNIDFLQLIITK